jgi:hypothetical protein
LGGDHIAPSLFHRHACAERIVAQRANLLVASPVQENTLAPSGPPTARYGVDAARMCPAECGPAGQYIGSKPPPKKTHWPCRGRRPRINKPMHRCGLPICRPYGALTALARRCLATDMSPRWGFEDAGAAMLCYRYVAPLGLWRRWRGDVLLPICRPAGALKTLARRCFVTDMSPRWGFDGASAAMVCYRYVAPLGLARPFG